MNPPGDGRPRGADLPYADFLNEIEVGLGECAALRTALNTLEASLPPKWKNDGTHEVFKELRAKLEELELERLRRHGPYGYLLITPLAPDAGEDFAGKAAEHVRALDDLGLIVRLDS
jgi:hypothetical protein